MTSDDQKHPTLDNEIKINLPLDRQVWVRDTLGCKLGIRNRIHVKSDTENIVIENSLDQSGDNELKVFKNNQLIKHLVNGVKKVDVKQTAKSDQNRDADQHKGDKSAKTSESDKHRKTETDKNQPNQW